MEREAIEGCAERRAATCLGYGLLDGRTQPVDDGLLLGAEGFIHADAFAGYDALFGPDGATEVACWAHTRRKCVEAEGTERQPAADAVQRIGQLYQVEKKAKELGLNDDERGNFRQSHATAIADEFFVWIAAKRCEVLPKGPRGDANGYAPRLEKALR